MDLGFAIFLIGENTGTSVLSRDARGVEATLNSTLEDIRGSFVRRIETAQTFLTPSEADRPIGEYNVGMSVQGPAKKYGIHRATVSAHLSRLGTPRRRLGLYVDECAEAVRLFRAGVSMCTIARRSGFGLKAVRDALFQANFVQEEGPKSR